MCEADFSNCNLKAAVSSTQGVSGLIDNANWEMPGFELVNFQGADLEGVNFENANLKGAIC